MTQPQPKKRRWIKPLIIVGFFTVLAGAGIYWYVATEKFTDTKDRKAAYTVSINDLLREFRQNEKSAKEKYAGKILAVYGTVSAVEPVDTTMNIKFVDTTNGDYAIFAFQAKHLAEAKTIKEGDSVSLKAAFSDFVFIDILGVYSMTFQRATINK